MSPIQLMALVASALGLTLLGFPLIHQYEMNLKMQYENQQLQEELKEQQLRFDAYREGNTAN